MNASGGGGGGGGRGARRQPGRGQGRSQGDQGRGGAGKGGQGKGGQGKGGQGKGASQKGRSGGGQQGPGRKRRDARSEEVRALEGPLSQVLARLPETQRRVVEHRMGLVDGHPANLTDTAKAMGMTVHEAKQVEQRAFEHIREAIPTAHLKRLLTRLG